MENTAKMYLDNRGVNEFFEKLITDERLNIIGENYRNKIFRRGRKYNGYNKYVFKNKILKAIKKGHYYLRKKETMECNVIILKHIKGDIRKIEKRIKL